MPRSRKSESSISPSVSMSSKPHRTKSAAYWPKPTPLMKATTGWFSLRCPGWLPASLWWRSSCSFFRNLTTSGGAIPRSRRSPSSISSKVSMSSKPCRTNGSAYWNNLRSVMRITTGLAVSTCAAVLAPSRPPESKFGVHQLLSVDGAGKNAATAHPGLLPVHGTLLGTRKSLHGAFSAALTSLRSSILSSWLLGLQLSLLHGAMC
mmetsp:Transcript_12037/g.28242  ORF Transcript_12037/g.28242 Transcript_12037/m.28242 type:complete len:206 (-) Transcript_12037:39-656(-)